MRFHVDRAARRHWGRWLGVFLFLGGWLGYAAMASAEIVRVEEDWEMIVDEPVTEINSPQVTTIFAPLGQLNPLYGAFLLNHRSEPQYVPGGLQLQLWIGEYMIVQTQSPKTGILGTSGETVRWTNVMDASSGLLVLEVVNGTSSTWGDFGGQGYLKLMLPQIVPNLDYYDPSISVERSAVVFGGNRVQSLAIKRVRLFTKDGQIFEDSTPRIVHSQE